MNTYKVLFSLRILKSILISFVDSFLVLYFLEVSHSNILPLGIYKLVAAATIYSVIFFTKNLAKSKHRVNLMRIGIIFNFIYFLAIITLKDRIVEYIYLLGILYGLEEGFYYSVYNMLESDGITNEERAKFQGMCTATQSILAIIFPIIFGSLIYATSFMKSLIIVLIIISIKIILSFMLKDKNIPQSSKANLKEYFEITKNDKRFKQVYKMNIFDGLTYSEGAFSYIVTIYIIKVFSDSFSLGIFTSIFSMIACFIGIIFARILKKKDYVRAIKVSMILTVISLCLMILKCNSITIVLFNLFQTISRNILSLINGNNQFNLCNIPKIQNEYKVEFWLVCETYLVIARIVGYGIFVLMAYINSNIVMIAFVLILILFAKVSINFQRFVEEEKEQ